MALFHLSVTQTKRSAGRKDTRKVFLCLDSDTAGSEACFRLAQDIPSEIAIIRLVPARKDWNDIVGSGCCCYRGIRCAFSGRRMEAGKEKA